MRGILGISLLALACGLSSPAFAQEQPGGPPALDPAGAAAGARASANAPAAAPPSTANVTEDIVVTAQFRRERLQDTPLAITAVTGDMMTQRSQQSITDVATRAPSVTLTTAGANGGGAQSFQASIRGIGQADFNLALEPGVGTYVDDVYYGVMIGTTFELLDLDRIEVLRGPQGTLSGKNSEGGAIKLFSKLPNNDPGGFLAGTYGSYNRLELRGSVNLPLVQDKLFLRFSGLGRERRRLSRPARLSVRDRQDADPDRLCRIDGEERQLVQDRHGGRAERGGAARCAALAGQRCHREHLVRGFHARPFRADAQRADPAGRVARHRLRLHRHPADPEHRAGFHHRRHLS